MIATNLKVQDGVLHFAGYDTAKLAKEFGTPLYLMDEARIRYNCKMYQDAMVEFFGPQALTLYASKALSFKHIYEIVRETGLGIDVVSSGEIHTAVQAGFPMEKAFFHGNNKTDADIAYAMDCGVGYFVVDNVEELYAIEHIAERKGITQKCLPARDPGHRSPHLRRCRHRQGGLQVRRTHRDRPGGGILPLRNRSAPPAGGGAPLPRRQHGLRRGRVRAHGPDHAGLHGKAAYQVRLRDEDPGSGRRLRRALSRARALWISHTQYPALAGDYERSRPAAGDPLPRRASEPDAASWPTHGLTLYTVGSVKRIKGYKNYVSVDGGMTDNPRYAAVSVEIHGRSRPERMEAPPTLHCDVVERCCESDDIIQPDVWPPELRRGDLLAAVYARPAHTTTPMASHYNRIPNAPIVMLSPKGASVAVRRETLDQMIKNDV